LPAALGLQRCAAREVTVGQPARAHRYLARASRSMAPLGRCGTCLALEGPCDVKRGDVFALVPGPRGASLRDLSFARVLT